MHENNKWSQKGLKIDESIDKIKLRMAKASSEFDFAKFYDHVVLNDISDKAAEKIEKIIREVNNEK